MKVNNKLFLGVVFMACAMNGISQIPVKVETFPVAQVRLTESPFKHAEQMDICYLLGLDADRLLAPYLKEAGLEPKAQNYPNWENTGLDGHIGGHYLSALSWMYASTGDKQIKERLDYVLSELKRCQDKAGDGYLCGVPGGRAAWNEIADGKIDAAAFSLNRKWVPLYNIHKIYAGLRDAYQEGGSDEARKMLIALTDWMLNEVKDLSAEQIQQLLVSEHGGLNEVFADVAGITGDERYLKLARSFSHEKILNPLLRGEDKLTGIHANTQIPKVIGFKRIADVLGDTAWNNAATYFWDNVVGKRTITIGGNSVREFFHPAEDFSSMIQSEQGPETCNTYNMLRLTKMLYRTSGDVSYIDYYERALYNHILSTQDPVQGGFVYFTPMRSGHYRVYSQPQTSFWCCVGSGMENHARYGEMIYGHKENDVYVNLFIPSILQWSDQKMTLEQRNHFPEEEATELVLTLKKPKEFALKVRCPEWVKREDLQVSVNGQKVLAKIEDGYVSLVREWRNGDKVRVEMPMYLRAIGLPDGSANYSFLYGPVVLAANLGIEGQTGLFADESRGGHIAGGKQLPLQDMPTLVGARDSILYHIIKTNKPLTFKLSGVYPSRYEGIEMVPFYKLYECRYAVYLPILSREEFGAQQERLRKEEQEKAALEEMTTDRVICGEQQPESDHFIQMEGSNIGSEKGVHWRNASGWFSYKMKTGGRANTLYVVCQKDRRKDARVWVNGVEIGVISKEMGSCEMKLPEPGAHEATIEVKIGTATSKETVAVYEVRLLKK